MAQLTEAYVDSLALNASAIKNGKDLVKKNSFPKLCRSEDDTLIFGECKGSGSKPYVCSVDMVKEGSPVFRCTCPSRQFPCKHVLGLMYAMTGGRAFETMPIPEDILEKRGKAEKREEKKKEPASTDEAPAKQKTKTSQAAQRKKIAAQLEGIAVLEKLITQLVQSGLGSLDKKMLQTMDDQAKQLGNYYVPGLQTALRELVLLLRSEENRENIYSLAANALPALYAVVKKSKEYLQKRAEQPDQAPDTESVIEEWIGRAWQLAELKEHGRVQARRQLLQLSFHSYMDHARGEYVDEGFWIDVEDGQIHATRTYRPIRAAKFIKEEDSFFDVMEVPELYLYPGDMNLRVRWEEAVSRPVSQQDLAAVRAHAVASIPEAVKLVKNQIKNPLADKHPVILLAYAELQQDSEGVPVLVDPQGKTLRLADLPTVIRPAASLIPMLRKEHMKQQAMLVQFGHDMENNRLSAQPLSIVTEDTVIRLLY